MGKFGLGRINERVWIEYGREVDLNFAACTCGGLLDLDFCCTLSQPLRRNIWSNRNAWAPFPKLRPLQFFRCIANKMFAYMGSHTLAQSSDNTLQ
jgi:hypothetical protein